MTQAPHPTPGKPLSDGWIEWTGGENPVPGETVEVHWSDGEIELPRASENFPWQWRYAGRIIAYRIVRPTPVDQGVQGRLRPQEACVPTERTDAAAVSSAISDAALIAWLRKEAAKNKSDRSKVTTGAHFVTRARRLNRAADRLQALSPSPATGTGWPSREEVARLVKAAEAVIAVEDAARATLARAGFPIKLTPETDELRAALFPPPPVIPDDQGAGA